MAACVEGTGNTVMSEHLPVTPDPKLSLLRASPPLFSLALYKSGQQTTSAKPSDIAALTFCSVLLCRAAVNRNVHA